MKIFFLLLKVVITLIVGQTLFFKFSGAAESVYIFTTLGVEPWGRIMLGSLELLSIILLWIPKTTVYALILLLGMMSGAVASHLFVLGMEIMGDGGELFILGIVTWVAAVILLLTRLEEVKTLVMKFFSKKLTV